MAFFLKYSINALAFTYQFRQLSSPQRENPLFLYDVRISTYRPSRDFELFKPDAFRKTEASVLGIQVDSLCSFEECARVLQEQTRLANVCANLCYYVTL